MKHLLALLLLLPFILSAGTADDSIRKWTSADGRTLQGTLQDLTPEKVTIRRSDGRNFTLAISALSKEDQAFLHQALADKQRMTGFEDGPYADSIRDEWVKFPKDKLGLVFQFYGSKKLRREKEPVPLFIHLHGAGARAEDVETGKVEIAAQRLIREEQYEKTPCVVLVPLCPPDVFWGQKVKELETVIDDVTNSLPIDRDRIYLSGYSMGARGIGALLESRPDHYAAAMFADGAAKPDWAKTINAALWLWFSGERDMDSAKKTAEAFQAAGKLAHYEGFPDFTHNQIHWKLAHDEEVFDWMFNRKRGETKKDQ